MGIRESLAKLLAPAGTEVHEREEKAVRKQEADRRAQLDPQLQRLVQNYNLLPKPYDAKELRDFAENPIAQAYVDTLAQDAATADWALEPRDEDAVLSDSEVDEGERLLKDLHPEMSFRDLREFAARDLLELGDATWVKHFDTSGELAEAIPVNSTQMYKMVDDHGFTDGYAQTSMTRYDVAVEFDIDEVVWFSWSQGGRNTYQYGYSPTEKGKPVIEILDELSTKELNDLKEGAPPGIVSAREDADNPVPPEEFDRVDDQWDLKEGQRHRHIVSRGDWDYVPLTPGYEDLQLLGRSKHWIQVLGSVFKVNSAYAGFDIENVNRATHESEAEAFRQRGFRVMLRYLEEAINKQLIWPHITEDLQFVFEEARTMEERKQVAELRDAQAKAGKNLADAGLNVNFSDGRLQVEDGEMEPGSDEAGGGGFFGSEEAGMEMSVRTKKDDKLSMEKTVEFDEWVSKAFQEQIQPETLDEIEKRSWTGDEDVPEFVKERISDVIDDGAIFENFESIPGDVRETLEDIFEDNLTQPQGWSLRSMVSDLEEVFPGVDKDSLETVARTESSAVLNKAREEAYRERPGAARFKFYWQGPDDSRTTELCDALKELTNPQQGGEPLSLMRLKREANKLHRQHFPSLDFRGLEALHPNERHTFVRSVDV